MHKHAITIARVLTAGSADTSIGPQMSTTPMIKIAVAVYLNIFIFPSFRYR